MNQHGVIAKAFFPIEMLFVPLAMLAIPAQAQLEMPADTDYTSCQNCSSFPEEWLGVARADLLEFDSVEPERRLDFLLGDWVIYFPSGKPGEAGYISPEEIVAHETFEQFGDKGVIEAFQYYGAQENPGFIARSDFRFIGDENRCLWTWMTSTSHAVMTGGATSLGVMQFKEYNTVGSRSDINLEPASTRSIYFFRNITRDQFIQEEWRQQSAGDGPYNQLIWRALYRRVGTSIDKRIPSADN